MISCLPVIPNLVFYSLLYYQCLWGSSDTFSCISIHVLQIIDEKSLIKKYQNEIRRLKEELEKLKMGIICGTPTKDAEEDHIILWKQKVPFYFCWICDHLYVDLLGTFIYAISWEWFVFSCSCALRHLWNQYSFELYNAACFLVW